MAYIPDNGSIIAIQKPGSIISASVFGTVGASILGNVPVKLESSNASVITVGSPVANQSVSGTVDVGNFPAVQVIAPNNSSIYSLQQAGSILAVSATITPVANESVSGEVSVSNFPAIQTVKSSLAGGIFPISGSVGAVVTNQVTVVSSLAGGLFPIAGSVAAFITGGNQSVALAGANSVSVVGSVTVYQGAVPWAIAGSVAAIQAGTRTTSLVSTVPSSVIVGASIFGQLPAGTAMLGSVVAYQGTVPWPVVNVGSIINIQTGSVITTNVGSVIVVLQAPSIVGTYAEDSAHTTADKGLFIMGVRNDTVASFAGSNGEYNPFGHDSAGRMLQKPFAPEEARAEGYNSVVSTSVTTLVPAAGTGLKTYITDVNVANTGATTTLITFRSGGGTSILGYTIAPAGGGSNINGMAVPWRTLANETFDFQATSSSSILYVKVQGFKAP